MKTNQRLGLASRLLSSLAIFFAIFSSALAQEARQFPLGPIGGYYRVTGGSSLGYVSQVTASGPGALAGLQVGDYIYGAFGEVFNPTGSDHFGVTQDLGFAVDRAEGGDGVLPLMVLRSGTGALTLNVTLPAAGAFGVAYPRNSPKHLAAYESAVASLHSRAMSANGNFAYLTGWVGLSLLSHPNWNDTTGAKPYRLSINKIRDHIISSINTWPYAPVEKRLLNGASNPNFVGFPSTWELGPKIMFLAEYYAKTGDATVAPKLQRGAEMEANCVQWWRQPAETGTFSPTYDRTAGMAAHHGVDGDYMHLGYCGINMVGVHTYGALSFARRAGVNMEARPKDGHYFGYNLNPGDPIPSTIENALPSTITLPRYGEDYVNAADGKTLNEPFYYNPTLQQKWAMLTNFIVRRSIGGDGHIAYSPEGAGWQPGDAGGRTPGALLGLAMYQYDVGGLDSADTEKLERMKSYITNNYMRHQNAHAFCVGAQSLQALCMPYMSDRQQRYFMENWRFYYALSRTATNGINYFPARSISDNYLDTTLCGYINMALPYGIANGGLLLAPAYKSNRTLADFKSPVLRWPSLTARTAKVTAESQDFQVDVCDGDGAVLAPGSYTALWSHVSGPATASFSDPFSASTTITLPTVSSTAYRVRLTITRSGVPDLTEDIDLTRVNLPVPQAPAITSHPTNQYPVPGGTASFTVAVTGTGPFAYQWRLNGVPYWGGSPSPTLSLSNVSSGYEGSYDCLVVSPSGTVVSNSATLTISANVARASGGLKREIWTGLTGSDISSLTGNSDFPRFPTSTASVTGAEAQTYGDNYGQKLSGWIKPPLSGQYKFFLTSDHASQVWLSTDTTEANKVQIAALSGAVALRSYSTGAQSTLVNLVAGQKYYFEILHKESTGSDHVSVAWQLPGEPAPANGSAPIDGAYLEYDLFQPLLSNHWKFDEPSGATCADSAGNATATLYNNPLKVAGIAGNAVSLNGVNQYAQATADISEYYYGVSLWFRTTQASGGIFSVIDGASYDRTLVLNNGNISAYVYNGETISSVGENYADGQWHHVVHTYGWGFSGQKIYVDNVLVASGAKNASNFNWQTAVRIGHAPNSTFFNGQIDDVRLYNSYIGAADVTSTYMAGINPAPEVAPATFSIAENSPIGTIVGTVNASDPGQSLTYSIVSGNIGNRFAINPSSGAITTNAALNYEQSQAYALTVRATDNGNPAASGDAVIIVNITDLNDAPVFAANPIIGQPIAPGLAYSDILSATDEDAGSSVTYSKVSGAAWLSVESDGSVSGTPGSGDVGINDFTVRATDNQGAYSDVILRIDVANLSVTPMWANPAGGSWPVAGNWLNGSVGNGSSMFPDFSTLNLTANAIVTLDGARTIGGLKFGDRVPSHTWTLNTGTGGALTLAVASGSPVISIVNQTTTINAALAGNQGFVKAGAGTLVLSGANTYTGLVNVAAGTVRLLRPVGISASSSFAVTSGASLEFYTNGSTWAVPAAPISLAGGTLSISPSGDQGRYASGFGAVTVSAPSVISIQSLGGGSVAPNPSSVFLDGGLKGSSPVTLNVTTNGIGLAVRNAATNYSGTLTVNGNASTAVNAGSGLAVGQGLAMSNADLIINGTMEMGNTGMGWGNGVLSGTTLQIDALGGTGVVVANMPSAGTRTLSIGHNNGGDTFSGVIANGANCTLTLIKSGTGTQILSGANTYTGATTVNAGTLLVNGSLGNTTTTVAAAATFGGTGSVNGALTSNGKLAPGNNDIGQLTVNNTLTLAPGSSIDWEISDWSGAEGPDWDVISASTLNITATSSSRVTVRLKGLNFANFTDLSKTFLLVETTGGITGFSADNFILDATGLNVTGGVWSIEQAGNNLQLVFTSDNQPPVFESDPIQVTATEDLILTEQLIAIDPNAGDTMTFEKIAGPDWLTVSPGGEISGTPTNGDVGSNLFVVRVSDQGFASSTAGLIVNVNNVNDAPVITNDPTPVAIQAGTTYIGQLTSSDDDIGDTATYSKVSGPAWLVVSPDGKLSGMPGGGNGGLNAFTVRVTDAAGASGDGVINFQVTGVSAGIVWINPAGGSWPTGGNWQGGTAASGNSQAADFSTLDLTTDATVSLNGARTIAGLTFDDATPSNNWTLNTGTGGPLTLSSTVGIPVVTVGNQTTTISAVIAGNQGLAKAGAGNLILSSVNTFTGQTIINNGTLEIGGAGTLGATSYSGAITNNGTFKYNSSASQIYSGVISGDGDLLKYGAGMLTSTAANTYTGATIVNAGTLRMQGGGSSNPAANTSGYTVNGGTLDIYSPTTTWAIAAKTMSLNGGNFSYSPGGITGRYVTWSGAVTAVAPSTLTVQAPGGSYTGPNRSHLFIDGGLKGSSNVTITSNTGGLAVVLRNGNSNFSGQLTVNGVANAGTAIGSGLAIDYTTLLGSADMVINGTLEIGAGSISGVGGMGWASNPANGQTVKIDGLSGTGVVVSNMGTAGSNRTLSIGNNQGGGTFSGVIANGANNTLILVKNGTGTQILSGANTYTGATTINDGVLEIGGGGSLGGGTYTGAIANSGTLKHSSSANQTLSGIVSGTGALMKESGSGNLMLTGVNTYTGATAIEGGKLLVNGSLANTATTIAAAGILGGTGTIAGPVINNGTIEPGASGVGNLTINNEVTLANDSSLTWEISNWTGSSGTGWDTVTATTLNITATSANPVVIRLVDSALANCSEVGTSFVLAQTTNGITGFSADKFNLDTKGLTVPQGTWAIQQSGNDLVLAYTRANNAPAFASDPITANATEDLAITGSLSANDPDLQETLVFSKVSGPAWLSVSSTGALSGTPNNSDVGVNNFTVKVFDSFGAEDTATLSITVANTNDAPAFNASPIIGVEATQDVAYSGTLAGTASDMDAGDSLTYSKVSGPAWLTVAANGALGGTPAGAVGINTFIVRVTDVGGLYAEATLDINVISTLPGGWTGADIGSTGVAGSASQSSGTYTVRGSGGDIGGTSDSFRLASQTLVGDGEIRARVTSQTNTNAWAKAGVMIRDGSDAGAVNALVAITPGNGFTFQSRAAVSGATTTVAGPALNAVPNNWVRLARSGTLVTAYVSANGNTWAQVGTATLTMSSSISVGLAVTSHDNAVLGTATFDNVAVTAFPAPWLTSDIGATGLQGSAEYFGNAYTVKGAGAFGGTSDAFRYVYQTLSGDGTITARVSTLQGTGSNARVGVMIRDTLANNSRMAALSVNGSGAWRWDRRTTAGGSVSTTNSSSGTAPNLWVRLVRSGNTIAAYRSTDGISWTSIGSATVTMAVNCHIGLGVASGSTSTMNTSTMDNVTVVP